MGLLPAAATLSQLAMTPAAESRTDLSEDSVPLEIMRCCSPGIFSDIDANLKAVALLSMLVE